MKLPRFTLLELFLLLVIAAIGCGWWVERASLDKRLRESDRKLEEVTKLSQKLNAELVDYRLRNSLQIGRLP